MIRVFLFCLFFMPVFSWAQTTFFIEYDQGQPRPLDATTYYLSLRETCGEAYGQPANNFRTPFLGQQGIYQLVFGATTLTCETWEYVNGEYITLDPFDVLIVGRCDAGTTSQIAYLTTIASIDEFGNLRASDPVPNPSCDSGFCVVSYPPEGAPFSCSAYRDPSQSISVGASVHSTCYGQGITRSGERCNLPDYPTYPSNQFRPSAWIPVENSAPPPPDPPPSSGGGGSSGGLTSSQEQALVGIGTNTQGILQAANNSETSTQRRHTESLDVLTNIKNTIQNLSGALIGDQNQPGILNQGFQLEGDLSPVIDVPVVDLNASNFAVPGEAPLNEIKSNFSSALARPISQCPVFEISLDLFSKRFAIDKHCELFAPSSAPRLVLEQVMLFIWSFTGFFIVLKA